MSELRRRHGQLISLGVARPYLQSRARTCYRGCWEWWFLAKLRESCVWWRIRFVSRTNTVSGQDQPRAGETSYWMIERQGLVNSARSMSRHSGWLAAANVGGRSGAVTSRDLIAGDYITERGACTAPSRNQGYETRCSNIAVEFERRRIPFFAKNSNQFDNC